MNEAAIAARPALVKKTAGLNWKRVVRCALVCALAGSIPAAVLANGHHGISAANLNVFQRDTENTTNSVIVTADLLINEFRIRDGSNRGDYNVQIGPDHTNDVDTGVIMTSVAENGRNNGETTHPGINYCTTAIEYSRSGINAGGYFIPVFNAPAGAEYNINVSAAFFSYANWICGYARNAADLNGGPNDLFTGSPGLTNGIHYVDHGGGKSTVNLTSLGIDSRTDGLLLVTHGKNEDNFALSQVNSTNGAWTVFIKDNGTDAGANAYEQDPVAFVFIPKTNTTVVSGRFRGDGTPLMFSGAAPQFAVTNLSTGTWRLTIPGYSPDAGVLILSPEGGLSQNQDNIVSYQPDGDGWIIQSRDLPGNGLQTPGGGAEPVASFVFIPAVTARLISPPDNARNQTTPTLRVALPDNASGNLTVQFYGREAASPFPGPDFTIAVLPDTQHYSSSLNGGLPAMFIAQAEWIITNRVARNIAYVAHLGDIVQSGDIKGGGSNITEWRNATNALYRLENSVRTTLPDGIAYGAAVGNHDQEPIGDPAGTTLFYNQYFGVSHFTGRSYYAGHYGSNNDNHFDFFSASGLDFIVIYFEYDTGANPAVLAWANQVLSTNQHRRAIVVTHYAGNTQNPSTHSAQGAAIYNALKTNANFFLMLGGHITGEGSRVDTFNGNTVRTLIADYQGRTNGGNGLMRLMEFSPSNNVVVVQTYSPWIDEYETDSNSEFFFPYNMQSPIGSAGTPFTVLRTINGAAPGSTNSFTWAGLEPNKAFEWHAVVTDPHGNTATSPTWRFITAPNSGPVVSNLLLVVTGDSPTNLTLVAYDPNDDPLTFETNSWPMHGVNLSFNPSNGTVTYLPAHNFRGFDRFTFRASDGQATSSIATMNLNVVAPPDLNGNGIPDDWEAAYGITDADADDDGDGTSNRDEYISNTNPTNALSFLRITSSERAENGHVTLVWPSVGGTRYRVQYSNGGPDGTFNGVFTDIVRPLLVEMDSAPEDSPSTQTFVDDYSQTGGPPPNGVRYYRIKVVQ